MREDGADLENWGVVGSRKSGRKYLQFRSHNVAESVQTSRR